MGNFEKQRGLSLIGVLGVFQKLGEGGGADKKGVQKNIEGPVCDPQQNDDMYPSHVPKS